MDNRTDSGALSPLDRTRLMIGVVMIPLAASCVFAAGVYSQRNVRDSQPANRSIVEVRAIYSDRRGGDVEIVSTVKGEEDQQASRLHSTGSPAVQAVARRPAPAPSFHSVPLPRELAVSLPCAPHSLPLMRAPPHAV